MNYREIPLLRGKYQYPVWERLMEVSAIFIYFVLFALLTIEVVQGADAMLAGRMAGGAWTFAAVVFAVPVFGYLAADFVSGFVHCAADNFGSDRTPIFGAAFIKPFREHHRDPMGITHHDFVEANGNSCIVNLLVLLPTFIIVPVAHHPLALAWGSFILVFTLAITLTNQFHKWAHMEAPPIAIRVLQNWNIILTPTAHQVHHTAPFDRYYCITNGWLNPALDKTRFFETVVRKLKR